MEPCSSLSIEELVRRCTSLSDPEAWEEFVRRLHGLIAKVIYKVAERMGDCSRQTVDDLIQETYLKLCADNCRVLRGFDHRHEGSFLGFLQVMAANVTRDHFRSSYARHRATEPVDDRTVEAKRGIAGAEVTEQATLERQILLREVTHYLECCTSGPERDRNQKIFWLYYRSGLSAREIATLPGIGLNTKGVESLIFRLGREVRERMVAGSALNRQSTSPAREGILPTQSF